MRATLTPPHTTPCGLIMQEDAALEGKVNFLIKVLKFIIAESGFELLARIEIKDKKTGRCFR